MQILAALKRNQRGFLLPECKEKDLLDGKSPFPSQKGT
jgi:hypothetical protein